MFAIYSLNGLVSSISFCDFVNDCAILSFHIIDTYYQKKKSFHIFYTYFKFARNASIPHQIPLFNNLEKEKSSLI